MTMTLSDGKRTRFKVGSDYYHSVKVLQSGEYVPIDLEKTYTVASHNYMIKNGGSGMLYFLDGKELVVDESVMDYQLLIEYFEYLGNDFSQYGTVDNRITIR
ncbi:MAG: hypothetical protein MJ173_08855 [Clostridia bacterium]|nr:hypothetical protein [Clostridia bacterium]